MTAIIIKGRGPVGGGSTDYTSYINSLKAFGDLFLFVDAKRSIKLFASGSSVSCIEDLSGYGHHLIQPLSNNQANYDSTLNNNRGGLLFNGSSDYYDRQFSGIIAERTIVFLGGLTTLNNTGTYAGGGILTIETASIVQAGTNGSPFDSLVYGERTAKRWMNGSENFFRTPLTDSGQDETELNNLKIAYAFGNGSFTLWRGSKQLSTTTSYTPLTVTDGFFRVGNRHTFLESASFIKQNPWEIRRTGPVGGFFNGYISALCVYRNVLNLSTITSIFDILGT